MGSLRSVSGANWGVAEGEATYPPVARVRKHRSKEFGSPP